ncbi:MAG TPA: hypothetical protein VH637_00250 [Streptosporangiaceae bacterium]|jgi:hypothetical protein
MRGKARGALVKLGVPLASAGTALMLMTNTASAASTGSNGTVYITISGNGARWNVSGRWDGASANDDWFGHIQVIGVQGSHFSRNGADAWDPQLNNVIGSGVGLVCVIGWAKNANGTYSKQGEPCEQVT